MSSVSFEKPAEDTARKAAMVRDRILHYIPLDTEGIDTGHLNEYREEMQADETPLLFLSPKSFRITARAMLVSPEHTNGMYNEEHDLALVQRNLAYEALNGAAVSESFGVHELAHGTHLKFKPQFRYGPLPPSAHRPTTPYERLSHSLWEEGYAELERGLYVEKYGLTDQFTAQAPDYASKKDGPVPTHYLFKDPADDGRLTHVPAAPAAAIFELLTQQDDSLLPLFRKSRHEYMGAIELAKTVDDMMPGLRHRLLYAPYSEAPDILEQVYKRFGTNFTKRKSISIDL